jgi:large subunit ribosomal protein L30e
MTSAMEEVKVMDINRALRMAIDSGNVLLGAKETTRALKNNKVKLVIVATNCKRSYRIEINKYSKVPVYEFDGNNLELGSACGKPFPISSIAVLDSGSSNIMDLIDSS